MGQAYKSRYMTEIWESGMWDKFVDIYWQGALVTGMIAYIPLWFMFSGISYNKGINRLPGIIVGIFYTIPYALVVALIWPVFALSVPLWIYEVCRNPSKSWQSIKTHFHPSKDKMNDKGDGE